MCYSALVRQNLSWLAKRYGAHIAWEMFEALFRKRLDDSNIQISRALDVEVLKMTDAPSSGSRQLITEYRAQQASKWEQELFTQRKRKADAERKLQVKVTMKSQEDVRIAGNKIGSLTGKLTGLRSEEIKPSDMRIFPKRHFAPVVTHSSNGSMIRPMRYLCRLPSMPAASDDKYPGVYNAFGTLLTVRKRKIPIGRPLAVPNAFLARLPLG
jgi:hypothetical protein